MNEVSEKPEDLNLRREGVKERIAKKAEELRRRYSGEEKSLPPVEIPIDTVLERLTETDKNNLVDIKGNFERLLKEDNLTGALAVVGGVLEKPMPRRDIDIALYVSSSSKIENLLTELAKAQRGFITLRSIAQDLTSAIPETTIHEILEPTLEDGSDSKARLKNQGSITIARNRCTPVQLINTYGSQSLEPRLMAGKPYAILSRVG